MLKKASGQSGHHGGSVQDGICLVHALVHKANERDKGAAYLVAQVFKRLTLGSGLGDDIMGHEI